MKKLPRSAMFTVFLGLGIVAFAQQNPGQRAPRGQQPDASQQNSEAEGQPTTLTGCLMQGATPNQYALTDNKSGEKYSFAAPNQLQKYVNQTVELEGTVMNQGGAKAFRPKSVRTVSPSCSRSQ